MSVAIVIPTLDHKSDMIASCLAAVEATAPDAKHCTITDISRAGFAKTCNKGAADKDADVLVFLNDDTIPQPGWLEALTAPLTSPETARNGVPTAAIAGAHLFYPDGRTQHSGVFLRRDPHDRLEAFNRRRPAPSGEVPAVTGACLAITRDLWEKLGGFDEGFVNGYEDVDLCLRARRDHDARVMFVAESTVAHLESQSDPQLRFGHAQQNIDLLQQRWGDLPI